MILEPIFDNMPKGLTDCPQWMLWREEPRKDDPSKKTKPPYQPNGRHARSNDPATCSSFNVVKEVVDKFDGVGFLPTHEDENIGIDFDNCRCPAFDGVDSNISGGLNMVLPDVARHIERLNSYTEISPSGKGIRVWVKGNLPVDGAKKGDFEIYQANHYLTVTGHVLDEFPRTVEPRQMEVDAFYQAVFGAHEKPLKQEKTPGVGTPVNDWHNLREKAFKSKNGEKIKRLWDGDPSDQPTPSEADLALCNHLAFWLNGDKAAIDAAFRQSGLMRDKWDVIHHGDDRTYGEGTISKALEGCKSFYGDCQTPKLSHGELLKRINATDDIGALVNDVARDVRSSGLSQTEINNLFKVIAKKTGGTIKNLYHDTRDAGGNDDGLDKIDHLRVAKDVVAALRYENLAYVSTQRIFRQWEERVWSELDDRSIGEAVVEYLDGRTDGVTKNVIESITDLIGTLVFREGTIWDSDTGVIPVLNGELAWNDGKWTLNPHVREHYRTTLIPIEYDPEALAPRFVQFLEEVFKDDSDAVDKSILICEMIGYTLTTSCVYEKFILLIGLGANGKSVLLEVIRLLVGPGQVAAVQPDQMENKFQRAHLCGKLANIVTEVKEGGEIADAALKAITSGELTTAEHKFKKPFEFQPFSTCWFGTNHMPHTRDFSDALFRRALIVEFNRVFKEKEQDKHLKRTLAGELPGILTLALTAYADVIKRGYFTIPESCVKAKEQWRVEADQVAQFRQDMCAMDPGASVQSGTLYRAYLAWAQDAGIKLTLNRINFSKRIQRLGAKPRRTADGRFFDGIKLGGTPQEGGTE